ncbi:MAG: DUF4384 domain-containing protein [Desulfobulbaceae bacterium]|nr:DUF4384 domain-containing protein [Desulfobulbaceae bacterium]
MIFLRNIALVGLVILSLTSKAWAGGQAEVAWAFFLKDGDGRVKSLEFDQPEQFSAGDLLRIYLQLQEKTYVYLYLYDSRQDLYLVFPPTPDFYSESLPAWEKYYIPSGRGWFTLDNATGKESFYLLASSQRLLGLEGLTEQFLGDREDPETRARLLAEIKRLATSMGQPVGLEQNRWPVPYSTSLVSGRDLLPDSFAHLTRAIGDFSLIMELVNP